MFHFDISCILCFCNWGNLDLCSCTVPAFSFNHLLLEQCISYFHELIVREERASLCLPLMKHWSWLFFINVYNLWKTIVNSFSLVRLIWISQPREVLIFIFYLIEFYLKLKIITSRVKILSSCTFETYCKLMPINGRATTIKSIKWE